MMNEMQRTNEAEVQITQQHRVKIRPRKKTGFLGAAPWQWAAHVLAWVPLGLLARDALLNNLTANPIQYATQSMGRAAIFLLMSALAVTPLQTLTGFRPLQKLSRPLGLYAFGYALIHFLLYVGVDYGFDLRMLAPELTEKKYIWLGLTAFVILLSLAVTSFRWWMKRLGKRWKRLHRLVYVAGVVVVIHYGLAVKGDLLHLRGNIGLPLLYGIVALFLLGLRVPSVRRKVIALRESLRARRVAGRNVV